MQARLLVAAAILASAMCPLVAAGQSLPAGTDGSLGTGDLVRVTVWRKPEFSGEFRIAADSTIAFPPYVGVKVVGVPLPVATSRIQTALRRFETEPMVLLEPMFRVAVGGEVRQPNLLSLNPETTIAQAVALAGGATDRGRLDRVRVLRGGQETMLDLTRPDAAATHATVRSGDQIIVDRRSTRGRDTAAITFSILGAVAAIVNVMLYHR